MVALVHDLGLDDVLVMAVFVSARRTRTRGVGARRTGVHGRRRGCWLAVAAFWVAAVIAASSLPSRAFFSSATADSTSALLAAAGPSANLSALSARNFSAW